jgi:hypothetical protein
VDAGGELTVGTPAPSTGSCIQVAILWPNTSDIREGEDGLLAPLTDTGRFHIERRRLNRPQLVTQRRRNRELQDLRQRLAQLEEENAALRHHVQAVEEQIRLLLEQIAWQFW